ncbi:SHOCT domain-containing protein [Halomarina litorea]|uniref:SHOCT domain-containing protein n=1 Tax=Halomarina litorea TaxID=2961595 RepID=UPI0020C232A4|nr:SHOCT domain-containing protein [Halomarina sp. BCD28]
MLWALVVGVVLVTCLLVAVVGIGAWTALLSIGAPFQEFLVNVLPWAVGAAVLGVVEFALLAGVAYLLVKRADLSVRGRGGRLHLLAEQVEKHNTLARSLGLSSALEPSAERKREDALDTLKRRYADGEVSDEEFERRLGRLLETDDVSEARAQRERDRVRGRTREYE